MTIVDPCLQRTVDFAPRVEEGFFHFPSSPKRRIPVKKQFGYLTIKFDQGLIFKPFPPHFTQDTGNPCHYSQTLVHPQPHSRLKAWQLSMDYSGVRMNVSGPAEGNLLFLLLKGEKQGRKISHLFLNNK